MESKQEPSVSHGAAAEAVLGHGEGYRVLKVELLNWGTFHKRVWTIDFNRENALMTGENGSGKSTVTDAILTLLVPKDKITYNAASDSKAGERSLYSYVAGSYKKSGLAEDSAAYQSLRPRNHYTVLLIVFRDERRDSTVTLAQVLWPVGNSRSVERFYVIAERALSIKPDFSDFGSDIKALKRRLKKDCHVEDTFSAYVAELRRLLGITSPQALELFSRAVATKQISNLSSFVKEHMLRPVDFEEKVDALLGQFKDLTGIYDEMQKAKRQIELLKPIARHGEEYAALTENLAQLSACKEAANCYLSALWAEVLQKLVQDTQFEESSVTQSLDQCTRAYGELNQEIDRVREAIFHQGGGRLEAIERDLKYQQEQAERLEKERREFGERLSKLERPQPLPENGREFAYLNIQLNQLLFKIGEELTDLESGREDVDRPYYELKRQCDALKQELSSLEKRDSNLPLNHVRLRQTMCEALGIRTEDLPFVGELIQVKETEQAKWQGAIERVLHSFALSLLVKKEHYADIVSYVNSHDLKQKLVYFRTDEEFKSLEGQLSARSLSTKLLIKDSDREFHDYVHNSLIRRFNYECVENLNEFKRCKYALTAQGQVKGGVRHEKDDRFSIQDRSRYVTGWSNAEKKSAMSKELAQKEREMQELHEAQRKLQLRAADLRNQHTLVQRLLEKKSFSEIDVSQSLAQINHLNQEKQTLLKGARGDELSSLQERRQSLEEELKAKDNERVRLMAEQTRLADLLHRYRGELNFAREGASVMVIAEPLKERLDGFARETDKKRNRDFENRGKYDTAFVNLIRDEKEEVTESLNQVSNSIIREATAFVMEYPESTRDLDPGRVSVYADLAKLLSALETDNLPKFIDSFKQKLRDNTIYGIANLSSSLREEQKQIEENIATINNALRKIDYSDGTYIRLVCRDTNDREIADFKADLRNCTSLSVTDSEFNEAQAEEKFLEMKKLIDRFEGRDGYASLDAAWRRKMLDVRNWKIYGAQELYSLDNQEKEYYDGSDGKSGGQKEKLAYTILAAAIAYQYNVYAKDQERSFRFVMIDEAFCRGSETATRHALRIFRTLGLQLLLVTPLQKIQIIEPYVSTVIYAQAGIDAKIPEITGLRTLRIEEYLKERAAYIKKQEKALEKALSGEKPRTRRKKEPDTAQGNLFAEMKTEDFHYVPEEERHPVVLDEKQKVFEEADPDEDGIVDVTEER